MVKYVIEIEPDDLAKVGAALDKLPHGEVFAVVAKIQKQITEQDAAVREQAKAEQQRVWQDWRNGERETIKAEMKTSKKRKGA